MKRLIVNADDFGYTRGVNSGVMRCFREGIVTSTTIMANGRAFEDAVEQAKRHPTLGVGCHLVLVDGSSVEEPKAIPSLVDGEGRLPLTLAGLMRRVTMKSIRGEDIAREIRAQITKVIKAGIAPTHLDSHKHAHAHPWILEWVMRAAEEFGICRVRRPFENASALLKSAFSDSWQSIKQSSSALAAHAASRQFEKLTQAHGILSPQRFWGVAATGHLNRDRVLATIRSIPEGVNEFMCHPGQYDEELERSATRLKGSRETEVQALTDPVVRTAVEEQGIKLISYRDLG
jgi:chitin disaccharide deacetylase